MPTLDPQTERQYWAARKAAALVDRSAVGRLEMAGADALDLLHRLSTQDLRGVQGGQGAGTVLTNEKGRIIDLLAMYHLGDRLLLLTSPDNQTAVAAWLDKYTIIEDARTRDLTGETGLLAVLGPKAAEVLRTATGQSFAGLPLFHHMAATINGTPVQVARGNEPGSGFHVVAHHRGDVEAVRAALLDAGRGLGMESLRPGVYETLRVEAGLPAFGREIGEQYNPLEAQLRPFISFTKGCYIGQEVVARLDTYQKVQKLLVGLLLPDAGVPSTGTRLFAGPKDAGFITSAVVSPTLGRPIALGYVATHLAQPGGRLALAPSGQAAVEVAALPLVS